MAIVQDNTENQRKISLPRRLATYITSMNIAKVFRRHHTKETHSKTFDKSSFIHHQHGARPFSYHIPATEQIPSTTLLKSSNVIPYRIGISSDSTLLNTGQTNDNDEIVRLPIKNNRIGLSPKIRSKDRRFQSQLNANKRWLFRSMETLDGWKGKVFPQKQRTSDSSQTRSHSVDNLAEKNPNENRSTQKHQSALSPNRSIEAITNRMINSIGIHRKSTNPISNPTRSPALTIEKHRTNGKSNYFDNQAKNSSSAILDFREISSFGFTQSRRSSTDNENNSLTPSDNINSDIHLSDDEITSNPSYLGNGYDKQNNNNNNDISDSWDFSITWIDSLKEQHSPQRKIQFYENLIKLLEQDTLTIDELLVLRKVLARIWPTDESTTTNFDSNIQLPSFELNSNGTRSLKNLNTTKRRSPLTQHTAQRCSTVIERSPFIYESLNEQYSGHKTKSSTGLVAAKAKPYLIENNHVVKNEQNYPQHLNPFDENTSKHNVKPSAPPCEQVTPQNDDSIRRYFERLTLLETIYEKLNIESNKTPIETKEPILSNKHISHRLIEMNVDGNGSTCSEKSSIKRRAPKAPHILQNNPPMFTLSSADVNIPKKIDQEINIPIQIISSMDKNTKEQNTHDVTASCDVDGQIFVYDSDTIPHQNTDEPSGITVHVNVQSEQPFSLEMIPRKTEQIQQWLSTCETKDQPMSPKTQSQYKMRCTTKPIPPQSLSPPPKHDTETGRFRSSLKIHLESTEIPLNQRSRASSATTKYFERQPMSYEDTHSNDDDYYQCDRQSVFL